MAVFVAQQPFSSYTFPKMKTVFSLKADNYNRLPLFDEGVKNTLKEIQSLVIDELLRLHKTSQHITSANEATRCEFISRIIYGVASIFDGEVKVYPPIRNFWKPWKRTSWLGHKSGKYNHHSYQGEKRGHQSRYCTECSPTADIHPAQS